MTAALALPDRLAAAIGDGVLRVLGVARTAVVTTFREGLLAAYREARNPLEGWWWKAETGSCCAVCYARHGSIHSVEAPFVSHVRCRCQPVPLRRGDERPERGAALFGRLSASEQEAIVGPGKARLLREGLPLESLVAETVHPVHGPGLRERSLRELGAG